MSNYHCSEQMHLPKWTIITDGYKIVYLPSYALYIFNSGNRIFNANKTLQQLSSTLDFYRFHSTQAVPRYLSN